MRGRTGHGRSWCTGMLAGWVQIRYTKSMAALRLEISDELKADLQVYARKYGISLAAAVRILLRERLTEAGINSARARGGVAP